MIGSIPIHHRYIRFSFGLLAIALVQMTALAQSPCIDTTQIKFLELHNCTGTQTKLCFEIIQGASAQSAQTPIKIKMETDPKTLVLAKQRWPNLKIQLLKKTKAQPFDGVTQKLANLFLNASWFLRPLGTSPLIKVLGVSGFNTPNCNINFAIESPSLALQLFEQNPDQLVFNKNEFLKWRETEDAKEVLKSFLFEEKTTQGQALVQFKKNPQWMALQYLIQNEIDTLETKVKEQTPKLFKGCKMGWVKSPSLYFSSFFLVKRPHSESENQCQNTHSPIILSHCFELPAKAAFQINKSLTSSYTIQTNLLLRSDPFLGFTTFNQKSLKNLFEAKTIDLTPSVTDSEYLMLKNDLGFWDLVKAEYRCKK